MSKETESQNGKDKSDNPETSRSNTELTAQSNAGKSAETRHVPDNDEDDFDRFDREVLRPSDEATKNKSTKREILNIASGIAASKGKRQSSLGSTILDVVKEEEEEDKETDEAK